MSNEKPLVSVVMPAYNTEKYISEAIESILSQTFKDFELIIIDDCSTDSTPKIINEYSKKDKRIVAIYNKENLYIARNRNKGLSIARGKYVAWQDADDISLPTRIEKLVSLMEKNPKIGICGSYIQSFDDRGNLDIRKYATNDAVLRANIFKYSPVAQPSAAVRREAFDKVGVFNEKYPPAEDIDISFRIGELYEFANIPEVLLKYREHPQSATYKKLKKQIASTLEVRKKYIYNSEYRFGVTDYLAYALTSIMQFAPYNITMPLFKFMRNVINKTYL